MRLLVNGRSYRWLAVSLALLGQVTSSFGLPLPMPAMSRTSASDAPKKDCGCPAAERAQQRCCCCPAPEGSLPACCAAKVTNKQPQPQQKKALTVFWIGGVLTKRCLGPLDEALGLGVALAA